MSNCQFCFLKSSLPDDKLQLICTWYVVSACADFVSTAVSSKRIKFQLRVLICRCLHGSAPSYFAENIHPVSSHAVWHHLWSTNTSTLLVLTTLRLTLGDSVFAVSAARAYNSLPPHIRDVPSLLGFRQELRTELFRLSYPTSWQWDIAHYTAVLHVLTVSCS